MARPTPLLSPRMVLAFLVFLFALRIQAQNNDDNSSSASSASAATAATAATTAAATSKATSSASLPQLSSSTTSTSSAETFGVTSAPALTTTTGSIFHLTGLPTLAGAGVPSVGVPDTAGAPYMQKSTLPEGTVFICVGAALGFLGASVLAWRALVAWSLHRSVKRAALNQSSLDSKSLLRGGGGGGSGQSKGMYSHVGVSSTLSLDHLASPNPARSSKYHSGVPGGTPKPAAASNLFFSPTAGTGLHSSTNRSSSYLPAGYYAPGASAPAAGAQMTHIGGPPGPLSMGPAAAGYTRARSIGPSPPSSPGLPPSRGNESAYGGYGRSSSVAGNVGQTGLYSQQSVSSLNLSATPLHQGRAPSAYLEDLFENHGNGPRERY